MDDPGKILLTYLTDSGVLTTGWAASYKSMPDTGSDNFISCRVYGQETQGREQRSGRRVVRLLVQVRVRSRDSLTDKDVGWNKGSAIEAALDACKRSAVTVGTHNYRVTANVATPLAPMTSQQEENKLRFHHVINVKLTIEEA